MPNITSLQVAVDEIVAERGVALCTEVSTRKQIEVRLLPMRVRMPLPGERWMVDRVFSGWTFAALLTSPTLMQTIPTISGTAPSSPSVGDRWVEVPVKVWNGTEWVAE